jgi:sugar lactone lactonase YvrE
MASLAVVVLSFLNGCASAPITADPVYFPPPPAAPRVVHLKSFNSLNELVPVRVGFVDAIRGAAVSPFVNTPAGIAYREGHLYICDTDYNVVHDWDLASSETRRLGLREDSQLGKPVAVAVDEDGTVYVADTGRSEVVVFDASGRCVGRLHPDRCATGESYRPVALGVSRDRLYVADVESHVVDVFSTADRRQIGRFGGTGDKPGQFYFPMGVAADGKGHVFVADSMNSRVQMFGEGHQFLSSTGKPGNRYGDMGKPRHVAVGPDGVIFVADVEFRHIHLFNKKGQLLMLLGGPDDKPGGTPMPVGVTVAETLPDRVASLVPDDFRAAYYLFVSNTVGKKRISLYAIGQGTPLAARG